MIAPAQLEQLQEAAYRALYDGGAQFDRDSVVPAVVNAILSTIDELYPPRLITGVQPADIDLAEIRPRQVMFIPEPTPSPRQTLLDAADAVDELDRIASTPKKDVTDDEFVRLIHSDLFDLRLTRADFARFLRARAATFPA